MTNLLDFTVLVVFIIGFIVGKKRGFIKSAVSCIIYAGSFILSILLAKLLTQAVYAAFIQGPLETAVKEQIDAVMLGIKIDSTQPAAMASISPAEIIRNTINSMPTIFKPFFSTITAAPGSFDIDSIDALTQSVVNTAFKPIIMPILHNVMFIVSFIITAVIVKIITLLAKIIKKIPGMGKIDHFLGGILGVVTSAAFLAIVVKIILFIINLTGTSLLGITKSTINHTIILKFLANI